MTHRERILAACRGEAPDRIPWVPRMDLWYNAHSRAGTLPGEFRSASLRDITRALDVGYHAVIPNFLEAQSPEETIDRLLGIFNLRTMCYRTILNEVDREVEEDDGFTRVTYHTPKGPVTGRFGYTEEMKRSGVSISWIDEHVLKGPEDYRVLEHIFRHARVEPAYEQYAEWRDWVGEDGVAVAYAGFAASPVRHVMRDFLPMTQFFLEMHDRKDELAALSSAIGEWMEKVLSVAADSPAEVVLLGGNYDDTITYPPFFEEHILPWLSRFGKMLHERGKLLLTHTDGENAGLLDLYRRSGFDIADSLCPAPMTRLTLRQAVEALPGITIWGGIPSVALCRESMPDAGFTHLVDDTLEFAAGRSNIILGIADTMPPGASFDRVKLITSRING